MIKPAIAALAFSGLFLTANAPSRAETPTTGGAALADTPRNLDTHHIFTPPASREAWERRAASIRRQILFSAGLLPMPPKTDLHPLVTDKIDATDYTIENVALETRPGFYLCGNLYRPKGKKGPFPAIVNPHGHWVNGRLEMQPDVPKADPNGKMGDGRGNLVAIGVNLARQGHIVFAYDMVGYNDTNQVDHKFAGNLDCWLHGVSLSGLQLWDSIRVVDYLESLPDVDRKRIGCTGASGGGTQTFLLTAVDDRIKCAVPVNMVSAYMQGGCLCENGPGLRVGTDNPEISACMAPRPQLLIAATGDWTKQVPREEWPTIKKVYDLYGAGDKTAAAQFNYQHNYNVESREAMYAWFGKWFLNDSNKEHFREKPFTADVKAMHVWTSAHPMPANALKEPQLIEAMIKTEQKRNAELWPKDRGTFRRFQEAFEPALSASLGVEPRYPPTPGSRPRNVNATLIVYCTGSGGKAEATAALQAALEKHGPVTMLALEPIGAKPDALWKDFYSTYNRAPLGDHVESILDAIYALKPGVENKTVDVIGVGPAGLWVMFARALSHVPGITVVDGNLFDAAGNDSYYGECFAPGLRGIGDVKTAAMLCAPNPLYLAGTRFNLDDLTTGYRSVGANLTTDPRGSLQLDVVDWIARTRSE